jgi:hypothetical protein
MIEKLQATTAILFVMASAVALALAIFKADENGRRRR